MAAVTMLWREYERIRHPIGPAFLPVELARFVAEITPTMLATHPALIPSPAMIGLVLLTGVLEAKTHPAAEVQAAMDRVADAIEIAIVEGALFLPAMVMLAAVLFVAFDWLIAAGHWLVAFYYGLLHDTLALPHAAAAALTVFLVPVTFLAVARLLYGVRWRKKSRPAK